MKPYFRNLYLAGPMRGIAEFNFPAFREARTRLIEAGFVVFCPAERDEHEAGFDPTGLDGTETLADLGFDLRQALAADTEWICITADGIAVLDGWERSAGARAEIALGRALGLPVASVTGWIVAREQAAAGTYNDIYDVALDETTVAVEHTVERTILDEAAAAVGGPRGEDYGHPADDFARTARLWSAILGTEVSPQDVALCMVAVKVSRLVNSPRHRDSVVDIAGYARTIEMLWERA